MRKLKTGDLFVDGFREILIWYADDDFVIWQCPECLGYACHEWNQADITAHLNKYSYRRVTK